MAPTARRLVIGVVLAIAAFVPLGGAAGAASGSWHEAYSGQGPHQLAAVSCNRAGGCVAYGIGPTAVSAYGVRLYRSANGGRTWRSIAGPAIPGNGYGANPSDQDAASCGSRSFCMVEIPNTVCPEGSGATCSGGASTFEVTTNDGSRWRRADGFGGTRVNVTDLTCPGVGLCVGDDRGVLVSTTDGGAHWRVHPERHTVLGVSCPTAVVCFVLQRVTTPSGELLRVSRTTNRGGTLVALATFSGGPPAPFTPFARLDCPSASSCGVAVEGIGGGTRVLHTTGDAGVSWTTRRIPGRSRGVAAFACGGPRACALLEYTPGGASIVSVSTEDGGAQWRSASMTSNPGAPYALTGIPALSCPSPVVCLAEDPFLSTSDVYSLDLSASGWSANPVAAGQASVDEVACTTSGPCVAVGSGTAATTTDDGATWTFRAAPSLAGVGVVGLSCPFGTTCFASGVIPVGTRSQAAVLVVSGDAGQTWGAATLPGGLTGVGVVTCATTTTCLASADGAGQLVRSTDGGQTWSIVSIAAGDRLDSASCTSATVCVAVGTAPVTSPYVDAEPLSAVSTDAGATWKLYPQSGLQGWDGFAGVTCTSTTDCVTTYPGIAPVVTSWQSDAYASSDGGVTWHRAGTLPGSQGADVQSCAASTCWGIGHNQPGLESAPPWGLLDESTNTGQTWTSVAAPNDVTSLHNLAVTQNGSVLVVEVNVTGGSVLSVVTP